MSLQDEKVTLPQAEYRRLGQSGLRVSVPILGAMSFGSPTWQPWVVDESRAAELLKSAWDKGVTTIDTANMYSNGESERIIGRFLKDNRIPRHRVTILTKCHFLTHDDVHVSTFTQPELLDTRDYVNQAGLSRTAIFNQVFASLERLQTPYIDLLQIHRFDPNTPVEETMRALHDLVTDGKVRYIGASSMRAWQFAEMNAVAERNGWTKFISMQSEYSLLYREDVRRFYLRFVFLTQHFMIAGARNDSVLQSSRNRPHSMGPSPRRRPSKAGRPIYHPEGHCKGHRIREEAYRGRPCDH